MSAQTTFIEYASIGANRTRSFSKARRVFSRITNSMRAGHLERKTVRELSALPPYILRDIGMRPDNIREFATEIAKERAEAWARQADATNGFGG